jgi:hypothetical protein
MTQSTWEGFVRPLLLLCLSALLSPMSVSAKLASIPVDDLIERSSVIVLARVSSLSEETVLAHPSRSGEVVFANAVAQRTLKGAIPRNFRFLAQTDFICSETGAVKDELALFFLYRDEKGELGIMAAGNGRMAAGVVNGKQYVTATSIIIFPKDVATLPALEPGHGGNSVELAYIEKRILHHAKSR